MKRILISAMAVSTLLTLSGEGFAQYRDPGEDVPGAMARGVVRGLLEGPELRRERRLERLRRERWRRLYGNRPYPGDRGFGRGPDFGGPGFEGAGRPAFDGPGFGEPRGRGGFGEDRPGERRPGEGRPDQGRARPQGGGEGQPERGQDEGRRRRPDAQGGGGQDQRPPGQGQSKFGQGGEGQRPPGQGQPKLGQGGEGQRRPASGQNPREPYPGANEGGVPPNAMGK